MYVIGTAGHVDHGKSTLVKALTGIDPDRLQEEKEREMTIDLGFAWLKLANGEEVGVVDVPGHERLVKNMLAGVGGIDLAMLVVAADEGVMAQTREHLAILDLLDVHNGVLVLTKKDLVDADWLELAAGDVRSAVKGTSLEEVPLIAVSSRTGEGLPELKALLKERLAVTTPRRDLGRPRLPIDRSFAMAGFGTVVTGTLIDGCLDIGQEVELVPSGLRARVRGLQSHRKALEHATPGRRLAVNLSGVSHEQIARGDVLAFPESLTTSEAVDARVRVVRNTPWPLEHNAAVTFHTGTMEVPAHLRLLDLSEAAPGAAVWAQVKLERKAPVLKGDRFILRNSWGTVGGGEVVEARAARHKRFDQKTLGRLEVLEQGTPEELTLAALMAREPSRAEALAAPANLAAEQVQAASQSLLASGTVATLDGGALTRTSLLISAAGLKRKSEQLRDVVAGFHHHYPLRRGMPKEEARNQVGWTAGPFGHLVARAVKGNILLEEGPLLRVATHQATLTLAQQVEVERHLQAHRATPYNPPSDVPISAELLAYLLDQGQLVRIGSGAIFLKSAYVEMEERVRATLKVEGKITVAQVRDLLGTSRKYALALMEHLDQQRITRRVGDERVLR